MSSDAIICLVRTFTRTSLDLRSSFIFARQYVFVSIRNEGSITVSSGRKKPRVIKKNQRKIKIQEKKKSSSEGRGARRRGAPEEIIIKVIKLCSTF
jgi:hypothetical protein